MKHIFCILIGSIIFISLPAQQELAETSHYLFPEFTQGVILMKTGQRNNALLNYNSLTEEMIFEKNGQDKAIGTDELSLVDTIYIQGRKFVPLNGKFVELIHHSTWDLFVENKCKIEDTGKPAGYGGTSQTSAITSISSLYSQGRVIYNLKLPGNFKIYKYHSYWLRKNGEVHELITLRAIKNLYKDKKALYKKYTKNHPVKYKDQESILQLIEYLESN